MSASKWEPPTNQKLLLQESQKQVKRSSSVYIKFDDEEDVTDEFGRSLHLSDLNTDEFGRSLHLSDLNTDEFGRSLHLSDLNTSTDKFGRDLSLSDLNTTDKFKSDLSLSDLNTSTDKFGRDLSLSDLNTTDEFGRDLSLKRDYNERRRIECINNFRPINRRLNDRRSNDRRSNDRRSNDRRKPIEERVKEIEQEPLVEEQKIRPFVSVTEDVDNLNIPKFEIDYGTPLPIPKINRKIIKKPNVPVSVKRPINWYDDADTDDEEETNDTDVFLTQVFNKISINDNDIRPRSPDYPPPKNQEEEEFDIYADLDLDL